MDLPLCNFFCMVRSVINFFIGSILVCGLFFLMFNLRSLFTKKEKNLVGVVINIQQIEDFDSYNNLQITCKCPKTKVTQKIFLKKGTSKLLNEILFLKVNQKKKKKLIFKGF